MILCRNRAFLSRFIRKKTLLKNKFKRIFIKKLIIYKKKT